jgi:RHS repeat-associated protein
MLGRCFASIVVLLLACASVHAHAWQPKTAHRGSAPSALIASRTFAIASVEYAKKNLADPATTSIERENYLRARYYDPNVGRFATMDSFRGFSQDPVSLHKYAYGNMDPINNIDPSGHLSGPPGMVLALQIRLVLAVVANIAVRAIPVATIAAALAVRSSTGSHPADVTTELRRRGNNVMRLQLQQGLNNHYWSRAMAQRDPAYVTAGEVQANLRAMFVACEVGDCVGQGRNSFAFNRLAGAFRSAIIRMSQWVNTAGPFTGGIYTVHQEYVEDNAIKDPSNWPRIDLEQVYGTNLGAPRK